MKLSEIIAKSPVSVVRGSFFVVAANTNETRLPEAFSVTRDKDEITMVCRDDVGVDLTRYKVKGPFSLFKLDVAAPFEAPGFLGVVATTLGKISVPVLIISTFSFDYFLVDLKYENQAIEALRRAGFQFKAE